MGRPYEHDLRRKFFTACEAGEETLEELAERFLVSVGWAKKISAQRNRTGQAGAELLSLPPYSPDMNPIQKA